MSSITYGRLDELLRSLGFAASTNETVMPPARVYQHDPSGAFILLPVLPADMEVQAWHLAGVRMKLDLFGVADPFDFDRRVQQAAG